ncbi:MAG: hypothetical protein J6U97_03645 [Bacteroidaceae bacterium]|nr:hypothetical protein [Bacteroidaceae bacterium]
MCSDYTTDRSLLVNIVNDMYKQATDTYDETLRIPYIFYLSDDLDPKVIFMNVDTLLNNEEEFEDKILGTINSPTQHNIMPRSDLDSIVSIINQIDFIDEEGNFIYDRFEMRFYVSEYFWEHSNNIYLISYLYWILGMDKHLSLESQDVLFDVHYYESENDYTSGTEESGGSFGEMNLLDINNVQTVSMIPIYY